MRAEDIRRFLREMYSDHRHYAVAEEVGLQTGYARRRLDFIAIDCYESRGFRIDGYEIKVSRSDLRKEIEDPDKHVAFFDVLDYFWLACPKGVVDLDIIPPKWGVVAFDDDGSSKKVRRALALHDTLNDREVPRGFLASVVRSIQARESAEAELRDAFERGRDEGVKTSESRYAYAERQVMENAEKLKEYDDLKYRFRSWNGDLNERLDELERLSTFDIGFVRGRLKFAREHLDEVSKMVDSLVSAKGGSDDGK